MPQDFIFTETVFLYLNDAASDKMKRLTVSKLFITCLYTFKSPEKTRLRTADPPEDDDPRLECGPDPWNFAAQIDWEGDDDGYPM
ncbi:hypothetical protein CEXT_704411 [Caerostris extrusa]|uniref:Uncharacterized protein n=1 Tax=Caerostris extrusa TaxID=172846 RepID=A0AAV4SZZ3_CAEEX|nr:hypothetical protein CEXT_704411 [Caerostris extrusa]